MGSEPGRLPHGEPRPRPQLAPPPSACQVWTRGWALPGCCCGSGAAVRRVGAAAQGAAEPRWGVRGVLARRPPAVTLPPIGAEAGGGPSACRQRERTDGQCSSACEGEGCNRHSMEPVPLNMRRRSQEACCIGTHEELLGCHAWPATSCDPNGSRCHSAVDWLKQRAGPPKNNVTMRVFESPLAFH